MSRPITRFADRADAGRRLAAAVAELGLVDPLVFALPRGGVPVAFEVARMLDAPLDLVLVRKIGAPGMPELALGAVVDGEAPGVVLNPDLCRATGASEAWIAGERDRQLAEIERRRRIYAGHRPRARLAGRIAVIVDDGLATGATARAAVHGLRAQGVGQTILAVPVAPPDSAAELRREVDSFVCLLTPPDFDSVGRYYVDFHQLDDAEVVALLDAASAFGRPKPGSPAGD